MGAVRGERIRIDLPSGYHSATWSTPGCHVSRFGSPPSQGECALILNLPEIIYRGALGELVEPETEDQFADRVGKSLALPAALAPAGLDGVAGAVGRARSPDCVGRRPQLMRRHVRHTGRLAGRIRRLSGRTDQLARGRHGVAARRAGLHHGDIAAGPRPNHFDGPARSVVARLRLLEVGEHVLRAVGGPDREQVMIVVAQGAAATDGDESRIADLGEDHARQNWLMNAHACGGFQLVD